ncbi:MAG: SGNH/GDSL hydrolase family protein [Muribaculaceae bacterium]|nr:SGNH/GDSL hydrolase family protein [Muribaculaceae bacterium]
MKRPIPPILSLWLLLIVALAIFIGISMSEDIKIGSHTLSKGYFPETLFAREEEEEPDTVPENPVDTITVVEVQPDTTVHSLLIFGDSMTHNLSMSVAKYGSKNNYKVTGVTWESSSIPGWLHSGKIKEYIKMSNPDFIIISLGSNEMELKYFDRRVPDIKKIVEELDSIPFVWVGPPLWKEDRGVYSMLEAGLPNGRLFRTENIEIPRGPDHVHPTRKGADIWADTLMRWIANSYHPILTTPPDSTSTLKGHKIIYLHPDD